MRVAPSSLLPGVSLVRVDIPQSLQSEPRGQSENLAPIPPVLVRVDILNILKHIKGCKAQTMLFFVFFVFLCDIASDGFVDTVVTDPVFCPRPPVATIITITQHFSYGLLRGSDCGTLRWFGRCAGRT